MSGHRKKGGGDLGSFTKKRRDHRQTKKKERIDQPLFGSREVKEGPTPRDERKGKV